ncbi:unnamed protein product [Adineta ricciae]|uniref:ADP ribosyltransferase domain-containing protein n=1 Tax=Adineta ricciae TaxID=249248 RepID=A0A814Q2Q7_ADIRI|nr:unnamed protein product [Adineta ricciae]
MAHSINNVTTAAKLDTDFSKRRILQNVLLIWIDGSSTEFDKDFQQTLYQIRNEINDVTIFSQLDQCVDFLQGIHTEEVFVISSGYMGQELVPRIHSMARVNSIYIFCGNQTAHKQWITKWSKIKGVYNHIQPICEALRSSVKQCNQDAIPVSFVVSDDMSSTTDLNQLEPSFMYTQLFKNTLIDMEHNEQSRQDLMNYCRRKYAGNLCELTIIDEFERSYCSNKAIWWYTRECFTYQMLNLALRLLEADIIVNMGFFIHDLHRQIEQLHQEQIGQYRDQPFIVYRGQGLSTIYFEKLQNTQGGLISFNNFLSTSKERLVSLSFAQGSSKKTDMVGILFVITVDPTISSTPFADIQSASYFQTEAEILFSMHSIFRINQLKRIDESSQLFEVQLTLTADDDEQLRRLTSRFEEETQGITGWRRICKLLIRVGQLNKAEELCLTLLGQALEQHDQAYYHNDLGRIKDQQGDHEAAIRYYELAIAVNEKILSENHPFLAASYNNIGLVYSKMEQYSKALSFYEKVLDIDQKTLPGNHPDLATSYNNIGLLYANMKEYKKALSFYEKTLAILQEALPANHPFLAASYNNIGLVYAGMEQYTKALPFYEKTLDILEKSLPANHPSLATSCHNVGGLYSNMGEYSKALSYFQRSLDIQKHSLPPTHPDIESTCQWIESIKKKI